MKKLEYRFTSELRAESQGDEMALVGYAALFNSESKDLGGFRETIAPGAFTRSLKAGDDVKALVNHDPGQLVGRTKNGTLTLAQDDRGLKFRVALNAKSQAHRDLYESIKRGDMDECSFAFRVAEDGEAWAKKKDNGKAYASRTLKDVNLMDVSFVTYPAYEHTTVGARSLFPEGEIPEIRSAIAAIVAKRNEVRDVDSDECYEDEIQEVACALNEKYPSEGDAVNYGGGKYWVIETYPDYVIVCEAGSGDYFKITYHEDEVNETFLFDEPMPVEKEWVPSERAKAIESEKRNHLASLMAAHKEAAEAAAKEASAHGDAADAIQKTIEEKKAYRLDHGLLDEEDWEDDVMSDPSDIWSDESESDDERAAFLKAETRADGKVRTKKVGGKNLTRKQFAFVGDPERTETWKLPIHDADHVRNALARFNQTEGIPAEKKASVYKKIVSAAHKFGIEVSDEDKSRALSALPLSEDEVRERRLKLAMVWKN